MKKTIITPLAFVCILISSCSSSIELDPPDATMEISLRDINPEEKEPAAVYESIKFSPPNIKDDAIESSIVKTNNEQKKIIKDGEIELRSKEINKSKMIIDNMIKKFGAYYENESHLKDETELSYNLTIRISSEKFESFVSMLEKGKDELLSKSIKTRDVTEDYHDTEIQLSNKEKYLQRSLELLKVAKSVDEILAVQDNIRILEEEIDLAKGHIKYLDDQITYSTLQLRLFEKKKISPINDEKEERFFSQGKAALIGGWHSVITFVLWLTHKWPFIVITFASIIILKRFIHKRRSQKKLK